MTSELAHAIDARIALLQIEAIVDQRDENWQAFEEIMRLAVVEVRSLEQNSICLLQFSFEAYFSKTFRRTTPSTNDLEQALADTSPTPPPKAATARVNSTTAH